MKEETIEQWARRTGAADRIAALYQPTDQMPAWMHEPTPPTGNKRIADFIDMYSDSDDPWASGIDDDRER